MSNNWETEIGDLLGELADVQRELLDSIAEKRRVLASNNHELLHAIAGREHELLARLQACHERRQQLLVRAGEEGLPSDSIRSLSKRLPEEGGSRLQAGIRDAAERSSILQHQSLTNWVLVQRTLLHLSQMVEIIATGGRPRPTYGKGSDRGHSGAFVDHAA